MTRTTPFGLQPDLPSDGEPLRSCIPPALRRAARPLPMRRRIAAICSVTVAGLTGCQSPTTLPTVDDAQRRPINSAMAIELQNCKAENGALRATLAEATQGVGERAEAAPRAIVRDAVREGPTSSRLAVFVFDAGQTALSVDDGTRAALREAADGAALIHVRGRSTAVQETQADAVATRRRAEAAATLLQDVGVPARKIRVSWQVSPEPAPEPGQSRRVEIEFVPVTPTLLFTKSAGDRPPTRQASAPAAGASAPAVRTVANKS